MYGLVSNLGQRQQQALEKSASDLDLIDTQTGQVKYANLGTAEYPLYQGDDGNVYNNEGQVYATADEAVFKQASMLVFEKIANAELEEEEQKKSLLRKSIVPILAALGVTGATYGAAKGLSKLENVGGGVPTENQGRVNSVINALQYGGAKVSGAMEAPFQYAANMFKAKA